MKNASVIIDRWLQRAEQVVSIYTILAGIAGFGIGACFFGPLRGFYLALGAFGTVGAFDVFHRQSKAQLDKRRISRNRSELFLAVSDKNPRWKPKVLKEFSYGGLHFRSLGFEQKPIPFAVSQPLCPTCESPLVERTTIRFPGRHYIRFECPCGFSCESQRTLSELHDDAEQIANCPKDFSDSKSLN